MGEDFEGYIWRPGLKPVGTDPTHNQDQSHTKTSLAYENNSNLRNLNKEILSASQLYNNTPKPFARTAPAGNGTSLAKPKNFYENQTSSSAHIKVTPHQSSASDIENMDKNTATTVFRRGGGNPSPKLVHKQYNSPIDLYSMNSIRKTIEAHTELIAPGIKGINFMKQDPTYNKQSSEVYKLIKEEEERKMSQSKSVSPISGYPVDSSCIEQHVVQHATQERHCSPQRSTLRNDSPSCTKMTQVEHLKSKPLSCFECGNKILGVFAKVADRFIHPDCFKCSTCGTSLKNVGFFTVNEKLYCRVHAEQVAKIMRISYDFKRETLIQTGTEKQEQQEEAGCSTSQQQTSARKPAQSIGLASLLSTSTTSKSKYLDRDHRVTTSNTNQGCKENKQHSPNENSSSMASQFKQTGCASSCLNQGSIQSLQKSSEQVSYEEQCSSRKTTMVQCHDKKFDRIPVCTHCCTQIHGPYILAGKTTWCKQCSQTHFTCNSCRRSLLDVGFIEDGQNKQYCEHCFEAYYAPICSKCNIRVKGDCLNALGKQWHPSCFVCGHCKRPFGNSSFYLEDNIPYCERDWNLFFTTKCFSCSYPIETGDKWIEALDRSYHLGCFRCTSCQVSLEDSTFYCKGGKPYCRLHVR